MRATGYTSPVCSACARTQGCHADGVVSCRRHPEASFRAASQPRGSSAAWHDCGDGGPGAVGPSALLVVAFRAPAERRDTTLMASPCASYANLRTHTSSKGECQHRRQRMGRQSESADEVRNAAERARRTDGDDSAHTATRVSATLVTREGGETRTGGWHADGSPCLIRGSSKGMRSA